MKKIIQNISLVAAMVLSASAFAGKAPPANVSNSIPVGAIAAALAGAGLPGVSIAPATRSASGAIVTMVSIAGGSTYSVSVVGGTATVTDSATGESTTLEI